MKEVKKLLEKIEQTPNKIIEEAIDNLSKKMNKEEIEKDDNYWKGYIEKQKEAEEICKMCNYRNKYKEVKEILDKVTDKLKEVDKKYKKEYENIENMELSATKICVLQELTCVIEDIEEILNIIEGEKK